MELFSGYYRRQEDNSVSLLLEQYVYRGLPVCLGCICAGAGSVGSRRGAEFVARLRDRFRESDLRRAVRQPEKWMMERGRELEREAVEATGSPEEVSFAGFLCIGESFLLFYRGCYGAYLCNTGLAGSAVKPIFEARQEREVFAFRFGSMEPGIGILLTVKELEKILPQSRLEDCLSVGEIRSPEQTEKRVRELGMAAERQGSSIAALLLEVR